MASQFVTVITTIQPPTAAVRRLASAIRSANGRLIVIGDAKGPSSYDLPEVQFLSLDEQRASRFDLARALPTGHYSRKNVGYLLAFDADAELIYETDDDNAPNGRWSVRTETADARHVSDTGWVNAYRAFTERRIWPRGFPLENVLASLQRAPVSGSSKSVRAPIQQGLADNSPDVDAVWRLTLDEPFQFDARASVHLPPGAWCPFNSQSTWWWPEAYALMYLPSYCSFRMTDIWRSFVAQRCLWARGYGVVFHAAEVVQDRNEHHLLRDFADETVGYLRNGELVRLLDGLDLNEGTEKNLRRCYEALVKADFFPAKELDLLDTWLGDLGRIRS